ncbi:f-box domain containing protein [Grosmannia clavigera kw1407]|uniref:F-box domain containing protein n=1 Tax=Grosmannia clavigera (strain kw1407 / UAMH 11150) TaxID=655863 RepID=F0XAZ8_GROCL|nr:f-box domain containing protein [Grosmannia clavigera kw1407]EFX05129.1 f-box domain containing protein [Grosmannia clavigera kw1407]
MKRKHETDNGATADDDDADNNTDVRPAKRTRTRGSGDRLSRLSDELLVRILGYLTLSGLLAVAPVSRRFLRLADDSQLWRALYYVRFVLPRALRVRGVRGGGRESTAGPIGRLQARPQTRPQPRPTDWKRQYKLRHNWDRGQCAVEELQLGSEMGGRVADEDDEEERPRMLVKVVDGIAVTADSRRGLQVWELKTRSLLVAALLDGIATDCPDSFSLGPDLNSAASATPPCTPPIASSPTPTALSVNASPGGLDIAVGRLDGGFDIWRLNLAVRALHRRFVHAASSSGSLVAIAYAHPLVLTATQSVLVSLYAWPASTATTSSSSSLLPPPTLINSLRSHTSTPPLALSIRRLPAVTIASIAYTFSTRQGWAIGLQDLHVQSPDASAGYNSNSHDSLPRVVTTRLAFSSPTAGSRRSSPPSANPTAFHSSYPSTSSVPSTSSPLPSLPIDDGPTRLCYSHPYLLATLPDNTLVLHLCTSSASSLAVSPGFRLWGHTSGISDAEITARGKAVSVSVRGDEMRVWELEGRPAAERGRSVAIRPPAVSYDWHDRRNWVGFDDEMVIVLKESRGGRESLMVYDFT